MRKYNESECIQFRDSPLSNKADGFPIHIGILTALSAEALYQAAKFPHMPNVQRDILRRLPGSQEKNPIVRDNYRKDWAVVKISVMRWVIRAKSYRNPIIDSILIDTGDLPLVFSTGKESYWGAVPKNGVFEGENVFGRLLMELRDELKRGLHKPGDRLPPPDIENFTYYGMKVPEITK